MSKLILFFSIVLLPTIIFTVIETSNARAIGMTISMVVLWFTEIIPLAASALLVPVMAVLWGVLPTDAAFSEFGHPILFLFIGSFLLAKSMEKHQLDKRISYFLLSRSFSANTTQGICLQVSLIGWFLSMWISNTASCAILAPLVLGLSGTLGGEIEDASQKKKLMTKLLLCSAFSSSIGGMATPVGSPPNVLAISFLAERGIHINFFQWMLYGLPVSIAMLILLNLLLNKLVPVQEVKFNHLKLKLKKEYSALGKIKKEEWQTMGLFFSAVLLWVIPGFIETVSPNSLFAMKYSERFSMGVVALLCSIPLFLLTTSKDKRNLDWEDAKTIDWGTVLLFGGGLTLGKVMSVSGVTEQLAHQIFSLGSMPFLLFCLVGIIFGVILSELGSNTASASILIPILLGSASFFDMDQLKILVIACAFGASFGFMLPVSTPPNAIIYGTGKVALKDLIKCGLVFDLLGIVIIFIMANLL